MKINSKSLMILAALVVVGGLIFLGANASQLQGRFRLARLLEDFPDFTCDRAVASVVVSDVTSEVPSEVTSVVVSEVPSEVTSNGGTSIVVSEVPSQVTSWVSSLVTSKVPQCAVKR